MVDIREEIKENLKVLEVGRSSITKMVTKVIPDLAACHRKSNYGLFMDKLPLREYMEVRLKHPYATQRPK